MPRPPLTPDWPSGPAEARSKKKRCPSAAAAGLSAYRFVVPAGIAGSGESDLSCCTCAALKPLKGSSFPQAHSAHTASAAIPDRLLISPSLGFPLGAGPAGRNGLAGGALRATVVARNAAAEPSR